MMEEPPQLISQWKRLDLGTIYKINKQNLSQAENTLAFVVTLNTKITEKWFNMICVTFLYHKSGYDDSF